MPLNGVSGSSRTCPDPQATRDFTRFLRSGASDDIMVPKVEVQIGVPSDGSYSTDLECDHGSARGYLPAARPCNGRSGSYQRIQEDRGPTGASSRCAAENSGRPLGTVQTIEVGNAGLMTSDDLVNLMMSLRTPHRRELASCAWVMSRATSSAVRKLKDADGRHLWADSLAAGTPPTLLGFEVVECEDMLGIGADEVSIAFANWRRGYLIADRTGMRMTRDPYTCPGWVRFYVTHRLGGRCARQQRH